jgi:hypothetical protein
VRAVVDGAALSLPHKDGQQTAAEHPSAALPTCGSQPSAGRRLYAVRRHHTSGADLRDQPS